MLFFEQHDVTHVGDSQVKGETGSVHPTTNDDNFGSGSHGPSRTTGLLVAVKAPSHHLHVCGAGATRALPNGE